MDKKSLEGDTDLQNYGFYQRYYLETDIEETIGRYGTWPGTTQVFQYNWR